MEPLLLQFIIVFVAGLVFGALLLMLWNKISSGSASASGVKQEYDDYQNKVEAHFEETSKKFQNMTEQYQDLYKHLSVGATSLCRAESAAAGLADNSSAKLTLEKQESESKTVEESETIDTPEKKQEPASEADTTGKSDSADKQPAANDARPADDGAKKEPELAKTVDEQVKVEEVLGEENVAVEAKKSAG